MNRLHAEGRRLYLCPDATATDGDATPPARGDQTRALVLDVGAPPDWPRLAAVWQAAQDELGLPAPAIAVNGADGHQLWFSLDQAVTVAEGRAWLEEARRRWLRDLEPARVRLDPRPIAPGQDLPIPRATAPERWSAFVVPGLAPLFAEEPWLDTAPSPEAQADLLGRLAPMSRDDFRRTLAPAATAPDPAGHAPRAAAPAPSDTEAPAHPTDPRAFLRSVMNDPTVDLSLRIEAARVLLSHGD